MMHAVSAAPSRKNILVWETPSPDAGNLVRELSSGDYAVTVARDLEQAQRLASEREFDVALIELDLPRQSSIGLLRSIHQRRPATKVVMVTNYGDEELWVDLVNEGASDLLCHPIRRVDFERAI